jgi:DUF4097 and DUF4098 domain-containing protein YvlB
MSTPPNMPPYVPPGGGAPMPPYDSKAQWQAYREQQKAAWRAQRDAWKAQRYAAKANCVSAYGPRVPSVVGPIILIGIGVVALLVATDRIGADQFWSWYGHWWPMLLIGAGLALLGEWALDLRRETPVRRSGSFVGILILLAVLGICSSGWNNVWGPLRAHFGDQSEDFFNAFGLPERDNDRQALNTQIPANASVEIQNPRGDVSITANEGSTIEVQSHEVAFANSDSDARKIFDSETPSVKVSGNSVLIKSQGNNSGRLNLTISVPKSAHIAVNAGHGDLTAAGLGAGISVDAAHGDVHLSSIAGSVQAHFSNSRHDFSAHQVDGDVTAEGDCNDLTLSEIKGKVSQNGEILGDVHMENIGGSIHLHTSVTDLQVGQLPGDLTLNSEDLRVNDAKGQVRVTTHSKDIDLSQIYGDSYVETRDGRIAIEPAGSYGVDARNSKGDVEVTLPPNASARVEAHTHNGDIVSDYAIPGTEGENKTATFQIGTGSARIVLSAENGDVHIKKGTAMPLAPNVPATPTAPKAPSAPGAPHLKSSKALPAHPAEQ